MGIALAQLAPASEDRVSGAQVIDSSLKFDGTSNYLTRSFGSGNRKTWTWAAWVKRHKFGVANYGLFSYYPGSGNGGFLRFSDDGGGDTFRFVDTGNSVNIISKEQFRDTGWYHITIAADTTLATESDRIKRYVNGVRQFENTSNTWPSQNDDLDINQSGNHFIGRVQASAYGPVSMSNVYFIDGLSLGPGYFGYTDPLTNTWRPKKFRAEGTTLNDGTQWSSYMSNTSTADNLFDGDLTTFYGPDGNPQTWIPAKPIEVATSVRIYYSSGSTSRNFEVNDNGNVVATGTGTKWVDLQFTGKLTKISGSAGWNVGAIEIDGEILVDSTTTNLAFGVNGFYLPMDGDSPIGQDQVPSINDGTIWSNFLTSSGSFDLSPTFGFDGIISGSNECRSTSGDTVTFTPPGGINYTSTVEIYNQSLNNQVSLNGGTPIALGPYSTWKTIATGTGTINTMVFNDTNGDKFAFGGIRVDGVVLVDSQIGNSWTPVNFGGSTDITKATGALPILNTLGGTVARPGVLGSEVSDVFTVTTGTYDSATRYELDGVDRPSPTLHRGGTYTFDYTAATNHPLYLSSLPDGKHNSKAYSVQFDGTDDRLAVGTSSDYAFGTGDFAIEMFIYHTDLTGQQTYFSDAHGDNNGVYFYKDGANALSLYDNNNNVFSAGLVELNKWHHIALTRSGGVVRGFIDGTMVAEVLDGHNYTETQYNIGDSHGSSSGEFIGYISNVRVLKGSALYTANFTPPTTTLTNITNTVLLCCQDSAVTTAVVVPSGQSITAAGNPAATNSHNPFLYNNVHGNFGINTATSNFTKITIPHLAGDSLYYYCNQHPNMGNTTAMSVVTDAEKADPYAWKNVIAMPLNNAADESGNINVNQTSQTITNSSTSFTGLSNFYGSSASFSRSSANFLSIPDSAGIELGGDDFTIEFWLYLNNTTNHYEGIISKPGNADAQAAPMIYKESNGNIHINFSEAGSNNWNIGKTIGNCAELAFKWHHVAITRDGSTFRWFLDGVFVQTHTSSNALYDNGNPLYIGKYTMFPGGNTYGFDGYLQDFRLYKGVAKYTSTTIGDQAFIPASTNPDILPDTPSGVATKTQLTKITDGAVAFDGTGDYLSTSDNTDLDLGNSDFTIEGFVYVSDESGSQQTFVAKGTGADNQASYHIALDGSETWIYYVSSNGSTWDISNGVVIGESRLKSWQHIALVRSGNTITPYLDGVAGTPTSTSATIFDGNKPFTIGADDPGNQKLNGFTSNVRVIKGTTLYTSNFIPPTAPLTNVTNTKLLTCQSLTTGLPTIAQSDGGLPIYNTDATGTSITSGTRTDSNSVNIDIALPLNGSDGGTTFTDVSDVIRGSGSAGTVTRSGTVTSTDQSLFYGSSAFFDGTDDYLEIPFPSISSTETWTIEWYQYQTASVPNPCQLCCSSGSSFITIGTESTENIGFNWRNSAWGNANRFFSPSSTVAVPGGLLNRWVHIVFQRNSDYTISVFANGELLQTSSNTYQASLGSGSNTGGTLRIGNNNSTYWFPGYIQDIRVYSGVAKYGSSSFIPPSAPILPSTVSPSVVNVKGNAAATTFNPFNTDINTVRGQEGAYATLNPLKKTPNLTLSDGNLKVGPQGNTWNNVAATIGMTTGKFYFECIPAGYQYTYAGIANADSLSFDANGDYMGGTSNDWGYLSSSGDLVNNTASIYSTGTRAYGGDVIGVAFDCATKEGRWYMNGVLQYTHTLSGNYPFFFGGGSYSSSSTWNFGQKPFKFPPPDGFQPLTSSTARPETVIARPDQYVSATTYTGNNSSASSQVIGGIKHSPDLLWIKERTSTSSHFILDTVRGAGNYIMSNEDTQQQSLTALQSSFNSDGFTVGNSNGSNENGQDYIAWTWKAGGSSNTFNVDDVGYASFAASGITAGTVTPTGISAGTKQGFSIIKYDGAGTSTSDTPSTIPHGLLQAPSFFIVKALSGDNAANPWYCYHQSLGASKRIQLSSNAAADTQSNLWGNGTAPTSSVISINKGWYTANYTGHTHILYAWHDVPGLQKFGTYEGTGVAGNYVHLGFRPALIWIKSVDTTAIDNWGIIDSTRSYANVGNHTLATNLNNQESYFGDGSSVFGSGNKIDLLSDGFTLRETSGFGNASGITFLYCAWAEAPLFNMYGAQSNAR